MHAVLANSVAAKVEEAPVRAPEAEVLDRTAALARVDGDLPLLQELAQLFLQNAPRWLADIRDGSRQDNARAVKMAAHTLRGSSGFFGAAAVQQTAGVVEEIAGTGDLSAA